jgi:hypothetical protein
MPLVSGLETRLVDPADLVDLSRYPLLERSGEGYAVAVERARAGLERNGAAELDRFVRPAALAALRDDALSLAPLAWRDGGTGTAYLAAPDENLPQGHPRRWTAPRSLGAVAYDLFPPSSPLRALYEWDPLMLFVEDILGRGRLYRYSDPCGALSLSVMVEGDRLQWHFDQTDFVVSLALQDAKRGGDFEFVPLVRSEEDERYEAVRTVLDGGSAEVVTLGMTPGTLLIFEGRHSIHRVTPVAGPLDRLVALLSYDTKPGTVSSDRLRKLRYGRDPEPPARK